jgi:hypothetical protein
VHMIGALAIDPIFALCEYRRPVGFRSDRRTTLGESIQNCMIFHRSIFSLFTYTSLLRLLSLGSGLHAAQRRELRTPDVRSEYKKSQKV